MSWQEQLTVVGRIWENTSGDMWDTVTVTNEMKYKYILRVNLQHVIV